MASKSLYVGNLPYSVTEDDLRQYFSQFTTVNDVRIIEGRGFGFVDVPEEGAQAAIDAIHNKEFGGRTLTVNEARPRGEGGGGRGGGGRGFGGGGGRGGGGGGYDRGRW